MGYGQDISACKKQIGGKEKEKKRIPGRLSNKRRLDVLNRCENYSTWKEKVEMGRCKTEKNEHES